MTSLNHLILPIRARLALGVLILALFSIPQDLRAQVPPGHGGPPETVEGLVKQMRAGQTLWISEFLRQVRGPRSPAELEAFSDSLVAFLQEPPPAESYAHIDALGQISSAIASTRGTSFVQGVDLFYRIYHTVEDVDIQRGVLSRLASVSPSGRLLPVLGDALESEDIRALTATRILAEEMGPAGVRILQDAYCSESIGYFPATSHLRTYFARGILDRECRLGLK